MFEWFTEFMESPLGKLISTGILAVAVLLLTLAAAGLVNRLMKKLVDRHRKTNSSIATVLGFVRYIAVAAVYFAGGMVIVGAIPVLSSAVRTLLATGGVIAVVAGLAAQEALGSVVSGVMILAFKPFKMGDVVRYVDNDITGCVEEITLHHTAVRTFENKRVIIPNSKMNSAIIENADYADSKVCVFLTVGITYESDLKKPKSCSPARCGSSRPSSIFAPSSRKRTACPMCRSLCLSWRIPRLFCVHRCGRRITPLHSRSSAPCSRALSLPMTRKALILHIRTCKS